MEEGIKGLLKDKGKGKWAGKKPIGEELRLKIITKTVKERPANGTLECAHDGQGDERQPHNRAAHLEGERAQAASHTHLQTIESIGAVGRRETANPGSRPHPARTAREKAPCWHDDP